MVTTDRSAKLKEMAAAAARMAISQAGGGTRLANEIGVTKGAVQQWLKTGIPADRLPAVERVTGIPCQNLRPDLWEPPKTSNAEAA